VCVVRVVVSIAVAAVCVTAAAKNCSAQLIIAHRGASHDAPENTLAAFRLAWEQQADGIEGDFYLTSDRQIICFHDKTTKRVAPAVSERAVTEMTLAELRSLDVGGWKDPRFTGEKPPTLEEVLQMVPPGKLFLVEIKCGPEILPILKPQLESSGLKPEQLIIIAFDEDVVRGARTMMPQYRANWLTSYKQKNEQAPWKPGRHEVIKTLLETEATGLGTNGNLDVVDAEFARALRQADREFHVWTINEEGPARTFRDLGVDSITTDRPAFIRKAIAVPVGGTDQP
jgi:glycerophosphoryl diester phosphodiesterase